MSTRAQSSAYTYISTATTTQVKNGPGVLKAIVFNKPIASSTVTIADSTSTTTPAIGVITNTSDVKPYRIEFDVRFTNGLRIVTSGADFITVVYE